MNHGRPLWCHEDELRRRIGVLVMLMDSPYSTLRDLQAAASLVASGCNAYGHRLDVASPGERAEPINEGGGPDA